MADPRNAVSHEGNKAHYETYKADGVTIVYDATLVGGSAAVGLAVTESADDTVALCADGDEVRGKVILVESDGKVNVQDGGYMTLPAGTGASLTRGKKIVGALLSSAKGYIREVATGTAAELGKARGSIINASDTANVVVDL
jgi:hypothetical protein